MFWLLFFYLLIYGAVHAILYLRLRPLLPKGRSWRLGLLAFFLLMVLMPILARVLEGFGWIALACAAAWAAYLWMAYALLAWAFTLILWALEWISRGIMRLAGLRFSPGAQALLIVVAFPLALAVEGLGVLEARRPVVEQVIIATSKLPPGRERLRLVLIADLHLGCMMDRRRVDNIIGLVQAQRPDLLLAAGDVVDGYIPHRDHTAQRLATIEAPLGKFAVIGNHEHYVGLEESLRFLKEAGFTVLRQEAAAPAGLVNLVGVDDPGRVGHGGEVPDEKPVLKRALPRLYTILMKHRPWVDPEAAKLFDLQVSGHTHGGQVYPFRYLTALAYPHLAGLYPLPQGSWLYVTRGAGTWGPPIRLLAPPEITVLDLVRDGGAPPATGRLGPADEEKEKR